MARGGGGFRLLVLLLLGLACSRHHPSVHALRFFSSMPSVSFQSSALVLGSTIVALFFSSGENSENISIELRIHRIVLLG